MQADPEKEAWVLFDSMSCQPIFMQVIQLHCNGAHRYSVEDRPTDRNWQSMNAVCLMGMKQLWPIVKYWGETASACSRSISQRADVSPHSCRKFPGSRGESMQSSDEPCKGTERAGLAKKGGWARVCTGSEKSQTDGRQLGVSLYRCGLCTE